MDGSSEKIREHYPVEKAQPEDAEQIRQVIHDSWIKTMSDVLSVPPERLEEHLEGFMTDAALEERRESLAHPPEGRTTFVVKVGGTVLGVISIQQRADREGNNEVVTMHVRVGKHGGGIGRSLWDKAKNDALDPAKDTFVVTTLGTDAVQIYKRFGFEEKDYWPEELDTREPRLSRPRVKMVRKAEGIRE